MKNYLQTLTDYNFWANERMMSFIQKLNPDLLDAETESSFPTIRKTTLHLWDAEMIWLERIKGNAPDGWPSHLFAGGADEMIHGLLETSRDVFNYVLKSPEEEFFRSIHYRNSKGQEFSNTVGMIVMHNMNHSTFHRGQLITMMRRLGETQFKPTDMIAYFRENGITSV